MARRTPTRLLRLAWVSGLLALGYRYVPPDVRRVRAYVGRPIGEFLATAAEPVALRDDRDGGRTYGFEYLRETEVPVPPAGPPAAPEPPGTVPLLKPAWPEQAIPMLIPGSQTPKPAPLGRRRQTYLLWVKTGQTGVIESYTWQELPPLEP